MIYAPQRCYCGDQIESNEMGWGLEHEVNIELFRFMVPCISDDNNE
jgi:hypothetical protein